MIQAIKSSGVTASSTRAPGIFFDFVFLPGGVRQAGKGFDHWRGFHKMFRRGF